jgi:hypothetical protein
MANLVERVQNILLKPAAEWDVIDGEPASVQSLFVNYAAILAAIPAVSTLIGALIFNRSVLILTLIAAVVTYVLSLGGTYLTGFIINALAPNFGAQQNPTQAMKLAVYANTPVWLAGVLNIFPPVAALAFLVGLYGLYLLYLGLPKLMKSPADKTTPYFLVCIAIEIGVAIAIGIVMAILFVTLGGLLLAGAATAIH